MADILDLIRKRIATGAIDMMPAGTARLVPPPASLGVIARDQATLGFSLPALLIRLYAEIANGGFGPGYGLIGLSGGAPDDQKRTAVDGYLLRASDPAWHWRHALLPICH